jgi:hypothetical protein
MHSYMQFMRAHVYNCVGTTQFMNAFITYKKLCFEVKMFKGVGMELRGII